MRPLSFLSIQMKLRTLTIATMRTTSTSRRMVMTAMCPSDAARSPTPVKKSPSTHGRKSPSQYHRLLTRSTSQTIMMLQNSYRFMASPIVLADAHVEAAHDGHDVSDLVAHQELRGCGHCHEYRAADLEPVWPVRPVAHG